MAPSDDEAFSFQSSPISRALSLDPIIESTLNPRRGFMDPLAGYPTFDHDDNSANTDTQVREVLWCVGDFLMSMLRLSGRRQAYHYLAG